LIASLLLTARRKCETAIREATPGAWTIARVKARTKPVPAIVPIAPSLPTLAVAIAPPSSEIAIRASVQEIDLFDFIAGQGQELALADGDDLQMGLEQRIIPRPQRGQETIASMLVSIWIHVGPTSPTSHANSLASSGNKPIPGHVAKGTRFYMSSQQYLKNQERK